MLEALQLFRRERRKNPWTTSQYSELLLRFLLKTTTAQEVILKEAVKMEEILRKREFNERMFVLPVKDLKILALVVRKLLPKGLVMLLVVIPGASPERKKNPWTTSQYSPIKGFEENYISSRSKGIRKMKEVLRKRDFNERMVVLPAKDQKILAMVVRKLILKVLVMLLVVIPINFFEVCTY